MLNSGPETHRSAPSAGNGGGVTALPSQSRRWGPGDAWLLAGCLFAAMALDLFFFTGFFSSDDIGYFASTHHIFTTGSAPEFTPLGTQAILRATVQGWGLLVMWLFGPHVQLIACSFMVFHLLLVWCVARLSLRLFERRTALVAAWLTATCPIFITHSTTILPDIQMTCCFVLALHAFLISYDPRQHVRSTASAFGWMLTSGLLSGTAYLAKESGLILLPFFFFLWLIYSRGRRWKDAVLIGSGFAIGVAIIFAFEFALWSALYSHAYVRMDWTVKDMDAATRAHIARYTSNPLTRLGWAGRTLEEFFNYIPLWLLCAFGFMLAAYCFLPKRRMPVLAMAVWSFGYLTWGTMRFSEYFPPSIKARYYLPVIPFVCMVLAFVLVAFGEFLVSLFQTGVVRRWLERSMATVIIVIPLFGLGISNQNAGRLYRAENVHNCMTAFRFALQQADKRPIVVSPYVERRMESFFAAGRPSRVVSAEGLDFSEPQALLELGDFYYICTRRPYKRFVPTHPIDVLIDLCDSSAYLASAWRQAFPKGIPCWFSGDSDRTMLVLPDVNVSIEFVGWFESSPTRLHAVLFNIGNSAEATFEPAKPSARSVGLFKVTVSRRARPDRSAVRVTTSAPTSMPASMPVADERGFDSTDWKVSLPNKKMHSAAGGSRKAGFTSSAKLNGHRVDLKLEPKDYGWLMPGRDWIRSQGALDGAGRFEICVEAMLEGSADIEMRLDVYADAGLSRPVLQKRINVTKSRIRFQIQSESPVLYVKPAFKLSGEGALEIHRLSIERVDG